jgi:hypothetical protein
MAVEWTRKSLTSPIFAAACREPLPNPAGDVEVARGADSIRSGRLNSTTQQA